MINGFRTSTTIALFLLAGCKCPWGKADSQPMQNPPQTTTQEKTQQLEEPDHTIKEITNNEEFTAHVLQATLPVIVDFHATWCGPCKAMAPIYKEIAHQFKDKFVFAEVDVDKGKDVSSAYGIEGVPSFLFFKDGKEIKDKRIVGSISKQVFEETLNNFLNK